MTGTALTVTSAFALWAGAMVLVLAESAAPASPGTAPLGVDDGHPYSSEEPQNPAESHPSSSNTASSYPAPKNPVDWIFRWDGWNGLQIGLTQRTPVPDPSTMLREMLHLPDTNRFIHLDEVRLRGKIGAKIALDGAAFVTSGDLEGFDGGAELRRARIYARGDCTLILPVSYELELGCIPGEFYLEKTYLAFRNLGHVGELKLGQFQAPMGLDVVSSSRDIALMEPAAPLQALAPGVNAGAQIGRPVLDERATWKAGVFTDGVGTDFGDASRDYGRAVMRLTGLPIVRRSSATSPKSMNQRLLHLGLSANYLRSASSNVRYQSRPESHLAPHVVDTGDLDARHALALGAEVAWMHGPFTVQGEMFQSFVDPGDRQTLHFQGWYGSASWFLTGESRPYDYGEGCFTRVIPNRAFNWGAGDWGAIELVGRYSHVDLDDQTIAGGELRMMMTGLNWHLHSHVTWRFNYGFGRVANRSSSADLDVFQTRLEVDF